MSASSLLHGAEVREGVLVSGDATVMAFCRHENKNNFVLFDVDERKLFCDASVARWLPNAVSGHLARLNKTIAEKQPEKPQTTLAQEASPTSTNKKPRSIRKR